MSGARSKSIINRVEATAWEQVSQDLDAQGNAIMKDVLSAEECDLIAALYEKDDVFRSRVVMERHGFGRGEYKYFRYPLPDLIATLRTSVYPHLVPIDSLGNASAAHAPSFHFEL